MPLCGRGYVGNIKLFLLLSSVRPVLDSFVLSDSVLALLCWALGFPQRLTHLWVIVKVGVLWLEDERKL